MLINENEILEKIITKMENNVRAQAFASGMSEEEVNATLVLNRKKVKEDAEKLEIFFKETFGFTAQPELPTE